MNPIDHTETNFDGAITIGGKGKHELKVGMIYHDVCEKEQAEILNTIIARHGNYIQSSNPTAQQSQDQEDDEDD